MSILALVTVLVPVILLILVYNMLRRMEHIDRKVTEIYDEVMRVIPHRIALVEDVLRDLKVVIEDRRVKRNLP